MVHELVIAPKSDEGTRSAYLVAPRELASMYALALLRLADAVGGRSVSDGQRDLSLGAAAHVALAADHGG